MSKPLGQQVLTDAIALIEDPRLWIQGAPEKRVTLVPRRWGRGGQRAKAYCIDGAIIAASKKYGDRGADFARQLLYRHNRWDQQPASIHGWNDAEGRTHAEVLAMMRGALQVA